MMDFEAFWSTVLEVNRLLPYDEWLIGENAPRPSDEQPTEEMLQAITEKLIEIEERIAAVPAARDAIDDLASRLNYHFDPEYAALSDEDALAYLPRPSRREAPSAVRAAYDAAVQHLIAVRASMNSQLQIWQALASTYTAARAKIEHDLQWQDYVRQKFGVDPSTIEREIKLLEAAA